MNTHPELDFEVRQRVACLTLNRPASGNAITASLARALLDAALEISGRRDVGTVLLSGTGRMFCAGGDIHAFADAAGGLDHAIHEIVTSLHMAQSIFARMSAPLVVAVNGAAAGGGFSLAIGADFTLAAESASFRTAYTAIGLSGDAGITYTLPRLIGLRRARELLLTNRTLSASEALAWGLIDRVCPDADLAKAAQDFAGELAAGAPLASAACKNLLLDSFGASWEQQLASEAQWMTSLARTQDVQQAVVSFLEKRRPSFVGR
ncbi:enoyl-CoA hydratase/isomerase family protein [Rhodoferax sediminis]|uniref:Enoyl-CoA hydratase n=1 Tax=Rhodoferax sediminis TaxID=2509614 RepID=A0A515DDK9_9BURK|nr:enoyl-CoA hydratase-related protein [Rhodoferax sediminis]QDL38508.1 enoyl-CoA hydratase [Rhodoferax sediminis]